MKKTSSRKSRSSLNSPSTSKKNAAATAKNKKPVLESTVKHWDTLWEQHKEEPVHEKELADIIAIYKKHTGKTLKNAKVLETGAGSGTDSIALAKMTKCSAYCVDYSAQSIDFMKRNFAKNKIKGTYVKADIKKIPFPDNTFDVIFSNGVLEHFREPIPIVQEQMRVLKKGGVLVFAVPETWTLYTVKKHMLMRKGQWFAGWETQYTKRELRKMMRQAGLKVLDAKVYGAAPLSMPKWFQKTTTVLHLNRWMAADAAVYCTKE
jgi:ubiquinone/menaquinone biosynthesis C-methylase UbiE